MAAVNKCAVEARIEAGFFNSGECDEISSDAGRSSESIC